MSWTRLYAPTALVLALALLACPAAGQGPGSKTTKVKDVDPRIIPKEKEHSSVFLRPPGADRYDPNGIDWGSIPPWRQTSCFGIRAQGQVFIYVVDCSGSMSDDDRLVRAKCALRRSILALQAPQRFQVIFYNDQPIPMPGDLPRSADLYSKNQMMQWLRLIEPDGKTDPQAALSLAVALRPDAIFLVSDGEFPEGTAAAVARKNPRKVPIHCIDLGDGDTDDQLKQIARHGGGQYRWRSRTDAP
jgi:hypothetical protein